MPMRSPLHSRHQAAAARFGDVAGWEMPMSYGSIIGEARRARDRAGLIDMSHVGRLRIRGDGALAMLERLCCADVARQDDDTAISACLCNERGGIVDNCTLIRLDDAWWMLCSPMNRFKALEHLGAYADNVKIEDYTEKTCQLSVVGPDAPGILDAVLPEKTADLPDGAVKAGSFMIARYVAVRQSLCGVWGLDVILPTMLGGMAWDFITKKAGDNAIQPVGLSAWDVLRTEAGTPAYGRELNETIDPITAGLADKIDFSRDFIGASALAEIRRRGPVRKLAGLVLDGPNGCRPQGETNAMPEATAIPRQGSPVFDATGAEVGAIASATFSPGLDAVIATIYVAPGVAPGDKVSVELPQARCAAHVVTLPFV